MSTAADDITVGDTIRWLHSDGLKRLTGIGGRLPQPVAAYTVDVATGTVTAHPVSGVGLGSEALTVAAEELPFPAATPGRLVIVGVTSAESVLVLDLTTVLEMAILADNAEQVARSWVLQLLLNPELSLTTNSIETAIGDSDRYRCRFTPGVSATILTIDDRRNPLTTIRLNPSSDDPDHLDVAPDNTGELYLGARFWRLRHVMTVGESAWSALGATMRGASSETVGAPPTISTTTAGDLR
jgi:hypothetical protein